MKRYETKTKPKDKIASLTARNNYRSLASNFTKSHLTSNKSIHFIEREIEDKSSEINSLTKELRDLKSQIPGSHAYRTCRQNNPFENKN